LGILLITAPEQLEAASESEISFIGNKNMKNFGPTPKLVLSTRILEPGEDRAFIKVKMQIWLCHKF
jgi:UDP-3-O-[3-hydroxymyristoyl] glucosamine N-acyltransferase